MSKARTAAAPKKVKKAVKAVKAVVKPTPKGDKKKKAGGRSKAKDAADALWKLADHPLVGELLAIGATAAVAAVASQSGGKGKGKRNSASKAALKAAGTAAAAAIGERLISEFADNAGKKAAKSAKS